MGVGWELKTLCLRRTNEGSVEGKTPNGRRTQQSAPKTYRRGWKRECEKRDTNKEKTRKINTKMKKISETKRSVEKYARQD